MKCSNCSRKGTGYIETKIYCSKHYKIARDELFLRLGKKKILRCLLRKNQKEVKNNG